MPHRGKHLRLLREVLRGFLQAEQRPLGEFDLDAMVNHRRLPGRHDDNMDSGAKHGAGLNRTQAGRGEVGDGQRFPCKIKCDPSKD
jgi:hypothetical protein